MVEQVGERGQGVVAVMLAAFAGVLGQVQRQRPIGTEQAEAVDGQLGRGALARRARRGQGGRRESQRRLLPHAHRFVARRGAAAQRRARRRASIQRST